MGEEHQDCQGRSCVLLVQAAEEALLPITGSLPQEHMRVEPSGFAKQLAPVRPSVQYPPVGVEIVRILCVWIPKLGQ